MYSKKENPKILIISSANPFIGPGKLAWNYYNAITAKGLEVDLLTKFEVDDHPEILHVKKKKGRSLFSRIANKFLSFFIRTKALSKYNFFYKEESKPPVHEDLVIDKINKKYDLVLIFFWQELLSFSTVEKIYDKLKCQIHFRCVDYSPMSGGCHFPINCDKYQTGCGCCPAWDSNDSKDFTYHNIRERERIYKKIKPVIYGNSYMQNYYKKSYLLKNYTYEWSSPIIDENEFYPMDEKKLRIEFEIPEEKTFILFFGSQSVNNHRKGISYLVDALSIFHNRLSEKEREKVLLLIAGKNIDQISYQLKFPYKEMGYVDFDVLAKAFSLSTVFLSPSVEDAGPMMVNQALSCGTPVVAFEMGAALDVVKDRGTGYCAKIKEPEDFASGIEWIFRMNSECYSKMSNECRKTAMETTSNDARVQNILDVYYKQENMKLDR